MKASFHCHNFEDLTLRDLYAMLQLRERVFVVEQNCPYLELDGLDEHCLHILGRQEGIIVATTRILPPGLKYPEASIGRVVTSGEVRGSGVGRSLMVATIDATTRARR